ncbi:aldehyde dehydrogenase domain-containing protein [Fusarium oxysporum]|nr:aldehyde dehydrogenase domain-containing protein [Fusarium oxysporum]
MPGDNQAKGRKAQEAEAFPWSTENLPNKLFINNEYVEAKSGQRFKVVNPKNESLVSSEVPLAGEEDVERAVEAAEAAFPAWRQTTATARRDCLLKLADLMEKHQATLIALTRLTLGMPVQPFGGMELGMAINAFRYFAGWTDKLAGESFPQDDGFLKIIRHEPLGVTAGIVPWNGPMGMTGQKAGPALATGNCFILKPSEKTPLASLALGALIKEAGFPPGVFQVLSGDGSTGALLASHLRVKKVSFTGSTLTGRKIQQMAAQSNLKRVTLELGGKSPAIIFNDADIDNAVTWCVNCITANSGQACFAASRVYVQEGIYDKFAAKYEALMVERASTMGDPDVPGTLVGPVVDVLQFERIKGFLETGRKEGKVLTGGEAAQGPGYFIKPTIFEDVHKDAEVVRKEIFGPVAVLNKFSTEEEIIDLANDSNYGLMAGIFTQDVNRAMRLASLIDSGNVGINCISMVFINAPFGGTKESGIGRENGRDALLAFTEPKTVFINLTY